MNYDDIISTLSIPEIYMYARDGISHSYPITGLYEGKIVDCFFLYSVSLFDENIAEGPLATLVINSEESTLKKYQEKIPQKFSNFLDCGDEEFWKADEDFEKLYPQVRSFAFSKSINVSQEKLLLSFMATFKILINNSFYKIYRELFPDFFEWTEYYQCDFNYYQT